jgi:glutamate carboxypeptidase
MIKMQKHHFVVRAEQMMAAFLADLETIVNIDSGTYTKEGIDQVVLYLQSHFRAIGFTTNVYEQQEYGNHLVAKHTGHVSDGPRILLIGHTDTVFSVGEVARRPFQRREMDGRQIASGPGILDMKSGLLMGLYALQILRQTGEVGYQSITVVCNSDEEIGSPSSQSLIRDLATQSDAVIVLEPGRQPNTIVSSRRGVGIYRVEAYGVSAHAGVNPQFGRNAIVELAHQIINLHALNHTILGTTLNVGVIQGGERTNIVPDYAYCDIDVRVSNKHALEAIEQCMRINIQKTIFDGTKVVLSGGIRSLPFEKTAGSAKLVELARLAAQELGVELVDVGSGGGSDANTTAGMGIPTVDGLGAGGAHAHNPSEYIELDYMPTRIALIAGLIQQICYYYQTGNRL